MKALESELESKIYAAVEKKDAGKLKAAYDEFIKVRSQPILSLKPLKYESK